MYAYKIYVAIGEFPHCVGFIVGHTGREPAELPFPVGCTTPVLGGLCVNFASNKTPKAVKGILLTRYDKNGCSKKR